MRTLFMLGGDPEVVEIKPGTSYLGSDDETTRRLAAMAAKRQAAIESLGPKYCLHNPTPPGYARIVIDRAKAKARRPS